MPSDGGGDWFLFNDETVSRWDPTRMERDCFGGAASGLAGTLSNSASAYLVVYDRIPGGDEVGPEDARVAPDGVGQRWTGGAAGTEVGWVGRCWSRMLGGGGGFGFEHPLIIFVILCSALHGCFLARRVGIVLGGSRTLNSFHHGVFR